MMDDIFQLGQIFFFFFRFSHLVSILRRNKENPNLIEISDFALIWYVDDKKILDV